jgi:hypothetical protein
MRGYQRQVNKTWQVNARIATAITPLGLQPWACLQLVNIDSGQNNLFFIFIFIFIFSVKNEFTVFVHHPFFIIEVDDMAGGAIEFQP